MYVVSVEASPLAGTNPSSEFGGAYINVYTTSPTETEALTVAAAEVREAGWEIDAVEEIQWVTREDLAGSPEGLRSFEQALVDGVVVVVHTYPPGSDTPDVVH